MASTKFSQKSPESFKVKVLGVVASIPAGSVMTYAQVAASAGSPGAARSVGTIMKSNWDPLVPCHRVVRSDGRIGEYNRGARAKGDRLRAEGVAIHNGKCVFL